MPILPLVERAFSCVLQFQLAAGWHYFIKHPAGGSCF